MSTSLDRCLAYLAKLPGAVSGSGGHNATLHAACECVRFELTDAEGMQALGEYNRRCSPPWSERELAHKLASARKLAAGEAGTRDGAARRQARRVDPISLDNLPRLRPVAITPNPEMQPESVAVAINRPTVADAMQSGYQAAQGHRDYQTGSPIVRQTVEVEEVYWAEVWRRLGRPDPAVPVAPTSGGA